MVHVTAPNWWTLRSPGSNTVKLFTTASFGSTNNSKIKLWIIGTSQITKLHLPYTHHWYGLLDTVLSSANVSIYLCAILGRHETKLQQVGRVNSKWLIRQCYQQCYQQCCSQNVFQFWFLKQQCLNQTCLSFFLFGSFSILSARGMSLNEIVLSPAQTKNYFICSFRFNFREIESNIEHKDLVNSNPFRFFRPKKLLTLWVNSEKVEFSIFDGFKKFKHFIAFKKEQISNFLSPGQCDQIGRNFTTLAKKLKHLATF